MARLLSVLVALCVLPAIVSAARPEKNPFVVQGRVYCDTCRAGFETSKTSDIAGAKVRLECRDRKTMDIVFSKEGTTDSKGLYNIFVDEEHDDQLCDAVLVSSPQKDCSIPSAGRERARLVLTRFNGIASDSRYANAMGFMKDEAEPGCTEILQQYQAYENED
uniref:Pollen-specific protein C13 n=1 Tax=Rhizophora mucronata TaxID=61149 RepID=A0A2P2IP64_RHIMU